MLVEVSGVLFHYRVKGSGGVPVLLLHGWGRDASYWDLLVDSLSGCDCSFYSVDLPGFGLSAPPPEVWGVEGYAGFLCGWMESIRPMAEWVVVGHSFGGKVALCLGRWYPVRRLVLLASAGVVAHKSWSIRFRNSLLRFIKRVLKLTVRTDLADRILEQYRTRYGSSDYRAAQGIMRAVLVRAVSEDVTSWLPEVQMPVLLIWGEQDSATPLVSAKLMQQLLSKARLVILKGVGHDLMAERPLEVIKLVKQNLKEMR